MASRRSFASAVTLPASPCAMARCASSRANSAWRRAISARAATTPSEDGTTMLKIFGQARSRTFRVLWLCEESSIPYEHIPVSIKSDDAQCKEPWYLALNPNGRVPTIDDDGFVMWESWAINIYLAKKYGSPLY